MGWARGYFVESPNKVAAPAMATARRGMPWDRRLPFAAPGMHSRPASRRTGRSHPYTKTHRDRPASRADPPLAHKRHERRVGPLPAWKNGASVCVCEPAKRDTGARLSHQRYTKGLLARNTAAIIPSYRIALRANRAVPPVCTSPNSCTGGARQCAAFIVRAAAPHLLPPSLCASSPAEKGRAVSRLSVHLCATLHPISFVAIPNKPSRSAPN